MILKNKTNECHEYPKEERTIELPIVTIKEQNDNDDINILNVKDDIFYNDYFNEVYLEQSKCNIIMFLLKLIIIIISLSLQIALLIITGGIALIPQIISLFLLFNFPVGKSTIISTMISCILSTIIIILSLISNILNIINVCKEFKNCKRKLQKIIKWINSILMIIYSGNSLYNNFIGITNSNMRQFISVYLSKKEVKIAIDKSDIYKFDLKPNRSLYWSGLKGSGEEISEEYAKKNERDTVGMIIKELKIEEPTDYEGWRALSAAYSFKTSGDVLGLIGKKVGQINPEYNSITGDIWLNTERPLLQLNKKVEKITLIQNYGEDKDEYIFIDERTAKWYDVLLTSFAILFQLLTLFII
jgi:hypothetical protein